MLASNCTVATALFSASLLFSSLEMRALWRLRSLHGSGALCGDSMVDLSAAGLAALGGRFAGSAVSSTRSCRRRY